MKRGSKHKVYLSILRLRTGWRISIKKRCGTGLFQVTVEIRHAAQGSVVDLAADHVASGTHHPSDFGGLHYRCRGAQFVLDRSPKPLKNAERDATDEWAKLLCLGIVEENSFFCHSPILCSRNGRIGKGFRWIERRDTLRCGDRWRDRWQFCQRYGLPPRLSTTGYSTNYSP